MQTKQEQQEQQEQKLLTRRDSRESRENGIVVDVQKLSRGLKTTFEGVAMVFDSLGRQLDVTDLNTASAESITSEENPDNEKLQNISEAEAVSESSTDSSKSETNSDLTEVANTADNEVNTSEIPAESEHTEIIEESEEHENCENSTEAEHEVNAAQDLTSEEAQAEAQQSDTVDTADTADTAESDEAKSSITRDDIVRLVTKKLKENRDINGPKIRKIINQHDAENLPQLTEENFEAVMTEIASL